MANPGAGPGPKSILTSHPFRALRHQPYFFYFIGQLISLTGTWVQAAALTWLTFELTQESTWTALVGAAQVLPTLGLGVWGGSLADRWPRRPLILTTQTAFLVLALLLTGLVINGLTSRWVLLVIATGIGVVNAIDTPARLAFVIDMVGRDDLANAVALNSLTFNLARAIGPAIGARLLASTGPAMCFLVNGVTFLAVLAALMWMRLPLRERLPAESKANRDGLTSAFRYLGRHRDMVLLLVLAGAMAFFGWPLLSLLPAVSVDRLGTGSDGYAWMLSAVGVGALVGALIVASFGGWKRVLLSAGVIVGAVSLGFLALVPTLLLAVICCVGVGGGLILFFATGQATLQLASTDHNRGRVMGIWLMVLSGAHPLGHLLAGRLADTIGVGAVLVVQAVGIVLAATVVVLLALLGGKRVPARD